MAAVWVISTSGRPWELFARAGFSSDFYDEQAQAFLRGRLDVDPRVAGPEGFLIGGKTYLYFGPMLAVVRLPFMLFGDLFVGRLVRVSMLVAMLVLGRWSNRLALLARARVGPTSPASWPRAAFVSAVLASPAILAAGWISVYNETELWALALSIVSITLMLELAAGHFTDRRRLLATAAAVLATTLTRAPIGLGIAFVLGLCGLFLVARSRRGHVDRVVAFGAVAAAAGPLIIHAAISRIKLGTLLGIPWERQVLTLNSSVRAEFFERTGTGFFSHRFLPTTLAQYLRPDTIRFERLIPWIRYGPPAPDYANFPVETTTPAPSITASATLLLLLAVIGIIWMLRNRCRMWILVIAGTAIGTLPTFLIGFIASRYVIDLLAPMVVAGSLGVWRLGDLNRQKYVGIGVAVLAVWGLWVNSSLAIWNIGYKTVGFTEARYGLDDALFGGGHESLITLDPGSAVPRDDIVAIAADCSGVWIAEQGRWVALDSPMGVRNASGTVTSDGVIAAGSIWQLSVVDVATSPRAVFSVEGGEGFEQPLDLGSGDFSISVDAVQNFFFAQIGDTEFFLPGDIVGGDVDIRVDMTTPMPQSALCQSLRD
jgi:hypothetical protein